MWDAKLISSHAAKASATILTGFLLLFLAGCAKKTSDRYSNYIDTTVSVYGPYMPVKLPITKGVQIANPLHVTLGPRGTLYAANQTGEVYSLQDTDNDGLEDMALLYCNVKEFGLRSPAGFAHRGDSIYIGTAQQIRIFLDKDRDGKADTSWVFFDDIPHSEHPYEWTTGLNFGNDGWLYLALSTDSWNAAPSPDPNKYRGSILKISPDGKRVEHVVTGIRSVYDMDFSDNNDLFFTDNEGGGNPVEELNRVIENGFYGHNPKKYTFDSAIAASYILQTEVAPSGIEFNRLQNDFGDTGGNLFVAFYGPGERWTRGGVGRIVIHHGTDGSYSYEEIPVADIPKLSNLTFGEDGSLYLSQHGKADYWYNAVYENQGAFYKLIYDSLVVQKPAKARAIGVSMPSENSIEAGKQLYAEHACLACHAVDGSTELLGPNLKDVGKRLSREEILHEVLEPSDIIKPSMLGVRITKKDDQVLIGRVVNSSEEEISLMLVGNHVVKVPRSEIKKSENDTKSLMYEGLFNGLPEADRNALLDYVVSLSN